MKQSLYDIANNRLTCLKNTGYDYREKIFDKSLSPYLNADPTRRDILKEIEKMIQFLVDKAHYIKNFINYTVDKNYKHLN